MMHAEEINRSGRSARGGLKGVSSASGGQASSLTRPAGILPTDGSRRLCATMFLLILVGLWYGASPARAAGGEPFLRKGDVIAFVGGEDIVAAAELGYLELLLVRALPDHKLRFRSLAWEGDTVFEQRRDLNYPTLEQQLEKIGATVVIAQFGQMESLAGKEKLPEFVAAYEKVIDRLKADGKRRLAIVIPPLVGEALDASAAVLESLNSIKSLPKGTRALDAITPSLFFAGGDSSDAILPNYFRDGIHLADAGQRITALALTNGLLRGHWEPRDSDRLIIADSEKPLHKLIQQKNRLWFHYYRPQNWAFLAGDRTNQPSSRDHRDPSKRWFPEELEQFIPLIEAKEAEIDALAAKLAQP